MADNKGSGLMAGLAIGTVVGAGAMFLFGTKRGKELRTRWRKDYPEIFKVIDDITSKVEENLGDKYTDLQKTGKQVKEFSGQVVDSVGGTVSGLGGKIEDLGTGMKKISARNKLKKRSG